MREVIAPVHGGSFFPKRFTSSQTGSHDASHEDSDMADAAQHYGSKPTRSSLSYQLAHETVRELEARGEYVRASELLAVALVEEAQRDNQRLLDELDRSVEPDKFKELNAIMTHQQSLAGSLRTPRLEERAPPVFARCLAAVAQGRAPREPAPRPYRILHAIADRWYLPREAVSDHWTDFLAATGGAFTLSLPRARQTLLAGQPADVAHALWDLAMFDPAKAQLISLTVADAVAQATAESARLQPTAAHKLIANNSSGTEISLEGALNMAQQAVATAGSIFVTTSQAFLDHEGAAGGAGGLNFEEYLVLRSFATATSLERQYRFLWRLVDRHGLGTLTRDELRDGLRVVLQVQRARLGWDDAMTHRWLGWALGAVAPDARGCIGPAELKPALRRSAQLRLLLLASEPAPTTYPLPVVAAQDHTLEGIAEKVSEAAVALFGEVSRAPRASETATRRRWKEVF